MSWEASENNPWGWEWAASRGLNKPSGSDGLALWTNIYLAPNTSTWLSLPYSPTVGVFTPTPKMTHRDRLKEALYFTGFILMAKQTHITILIKNTILEKAAEGGGESPSPVLARWWLRWLLKAEGGSEMNLQSNSS